MGSETWTFTPKICDACRTTPAAVFCRADSAFLCAGCDGDIHSANKLASRHHRLPLYDAASTTKSSPASEEEAEVASWLLPHPNGKAADGSGSPEYKSVEYLFNDLDPCLDLDLISYEHRPKNDAVLDERDQQYYSTDRVVPVQCKNETGQAPTPVVDGLPTCEVNYPGISNPSLCNFTSQSVSSPSLDVGLVPDHNPMADTTNTFSTNEIVPAGFDREARVLRYREKRKNRKFEKTIRYASRKAYAETRPRIKGRFAKRSELEVDSSSYFVVPTF